MIHFIASFWHGSEANIMIWVDKFKLGPATAKSHIIIPQGLEKPQHSGHIINLLAMFGRLTWNDLVGFQNSGKSFGPTWNIYPVFDLI